MPYLLSQLTLSIFNRDHNHSLILTKYLELPKHKHTNVNDASVAASGYCRKNIISPDFPHFAYIHFYADESVFYIRVYFSES